MQLKTEDIRHDSYRLIVGGSSYSMTHLPTGISVQEEEGVADWPVVKRWEELIRKLTLKVESKLGATDTPS